MSLRAFVAVSYRLGGLAPLHLRVVKYAAKHNTAAASRVLPKRPQVIVLGDLNRDIFLRLTSRPKSGRHNLVQSFAAVPGGSAFHPAAVLVQLEIPTGVVARVGRDAEGGALLREISRMGIFTRHVQRDPEERTGFCVIPVTPDGELTLMSARGANSSLDKEGIGEAALHIRHLHVSGQTLVEPGPRTAAVEALRAARQGGATTSLDFSRRAAVSASEAIREALAHVTVALPSATELRVALGLRQLSRAAEAAHELGAEQIAVTLGAGGCRIFSAGGAFRVPPFDTRAAGGGGAFDAFIAGYIFGLLHKAAPEVCGVIATAAGAAAARSEYTYDSLGRERLARLLREEQNRARRKKHVEAIHKALELLSNRGQSKRKTTRPTKPRRARA